MDNRMARLQPFVGAWRLESSLGAVRATSVFEWALGGAFLLQRTEVDLPEAPDSLSVITADGDSYRQHYFDSRGVVRLYAMTFDGHMWTLLRETADVSPLDFAQRYAGTFSDDGARISGRWETKHPG